MFDFSQVTNFERRLVDASDTRDVEKEWTEKTASNLAEEIRPPVHSGELADSVRATRGGVAMADYWRYPEYGTARMAARPFVRPAISRHTPKALEDLGDKVLRELT